MPTQRQICMTEGTANFSMHKYRHRQWPKKQAAGSGQGADTLPSAPAVDREAGTAAVIDPYAGTIVAPALSANAACPRQLLFNPRRTTTSKVDPAQLIALVIALAGKTDRLGWIRRTIAVATWPVPMVLTIPDYHKASATSPVHPYARTVVTPAPTAHAACPRQLLFNARCSMPAEIDLAQAIALVVAFAAETDGLTVPARMRPGSIIVIGSVSATTTDDEAGTTAPIHPHAGAIEAPTLTPHTPGARQAPVNSSRAPATEINPAQLIALILTLAGQADVAVPVAASVALCVALASWQQKSGYCDQYCNRNLDGHMLFPGDKA